MEDYVLIIENGNNKREYPFKTEELVSLGDVCDEIIIENGVLSINKRIGITDEFLFYVLEKPYIIEVETEPIELFFDYNKIYVQTLNGDFVLQYITNNPFNYNLIKLVDMKSSIEIELNKIILKVSKNKIISEINQSLEEIKINSNKIALEGHTTINGNFKIDLQGNMQCNDANINNLVNKSGIFTGLVFHHKKEVLNIKGASLKSYIGYKAIWNADYTNATLVRVPLYINYTIPNEFIVTEAYIIAEFQSVAWGRAGGPAGSAPIGTVKNIELYLKPTAENSTSINAYSVYKQTKNPQYYIGTRINNVWGSGVHGYTFPNGLRRKKTANIASTLNNNKSGILALAPRATTEAFDPNDMYGYGERRYSGYMSATLYVYGYLNKE